MIQAEFTWEFNHQQFDIYSKLVGVSVNGGKPHAVASLFFSPIAPNYPDFIEKLAGEQSVGFNYNAVHFEDIPALDLFVGQGTVLLVDFEGQTSLSRSLFFPIALGFAETALRREAELELIAQGKLPPDWRPRIEAVLPKLEALAKKEA